MNYRNKAWYPAPAKQPPFELLADRKTGLDNSNTMDGDSSRKRRHRSSRHRHRSRRRPSPRPPALTPAPIQRPESQHPLCNLCRHPKDPIRRLPCSHNGCSECLTWLVKLACESGATFPPRCCPGKPLRRDDIAWLDNRDLWSKYHDCLVVLCGYPRELRCGSCNKLTPLIEAKMESEDKWRCGNPKCKCVNRLEPDDKTKVAGSTCPSCLQEARYV